MTGMVGVGSGLPLGDMIRDFVNIERKPKVDRINKKEIRLNTELSGVESSALAGASFHRAHEEQFQPKG